MTNESSAKQWESDQVLGLLALWAPPAATEATWEGQCDLSCPKSCVDPAGWENGPTGLEPLRISWSSSKVWHFTWWALKTEVWPVPHLSNLATKTSFKTNMISKVSTSHNHPAVNGPKASLNTCYWWDTQNLGKISCNSCHPREAATGNSTCRANLNSVDLLCLCSHRSATPGMLYSSSKGACYLLPHWAEALIPMLIPQCCSIKITQLFLL